MFVYRVSIVSRKNLTNRQITVPHGGLPSMFFTNSFLPTRGVGTSGAQGHVPPQYFDQLGAVPLQHFQQLSGSTKCVPLQYLPPSYAPGT